MPTPAADNAHPPDATNGRRDREREALIEQATQRVLERLAADGWVEAPSPWLTTSAAATYLALSLDRVRRLASARAIPHRRVGNTIRFHRDELDRWLDGYRAGSAQPPDAWPVFPRDFQTPATPANKRASQRPSRSFLDGLNPGGDRNERR